ncbi:glycosyl transferase family 2 [Geobacillus sp. Manikaran-105]|uniref:glycosyltransferase family 2 protein n=1 Tax=Geobacillus sp. Manikaran-105 TaxID=2055940 RepID=UPI000C28D1B8|nr:glycosyltransferase [Geobacillus sp. Manikaran-105]PJW13251.1 glycosyl transferase family 2 [Geobacillus sp. Manikaran-105]
MLHVYSIVVPVYNVESYLRRCLDSLLSQSLNDIEIIVVNDGSTDNSLEILNEYAKKDNRVIVVNKSNSGVSSARNEGICIARGEYIGFVDPDDWVDLNMYEEMYNTAVADKADIVMCGYIREFGSHSKEKKFPLPEKVCYQNSQIHSNVMRRLVGPLNEEMRNPELLDAWGTVWSKLYRSEIIKENGLRFVDLSEIGTNEDSLFNINAFYYAKTFVFLNKPYYHYWRANTTSVTAKYKPNLIDQWFKLYDYIENFLNEKKMGQDFYLALNNRICLNALGLGLNIISKENNMSVLMRIKQLRKILNDNRLKNAFRQFNIGYFPFAWKVFYFCAKYRLTLAYYVMLVAIEYFRKKIR